RDHQCLGRRRPPARRPDPRPPRRPPEPPSTTTAPEATSTDTACTSSPHTSPASDHGGPPASTPPTKTLVPSPVDAAQARLCRRGLRSKLVDSGARKQIRLASQTSLRR